MLIRLVDEPLRGLDLLPEIYEFGSVLHIGCARVACEAVPDPVSAV